MEIKPKLVKLEDVLKSINEDTPLSEIAERLGDEFNTAHSLAATLRYLGYQVRSKSTWQSEFKRAKKISYLFYDN